MNTAYSVKGEVSIRNENGTARFNDDNCGSWIQHWKNYGGNDDFPLCCVKGCNNFAEHGAHVTRPNAKNEYYKTHFYIVPMCAHHNGMHGKILTAVAETVFVRANQSETCGQ